MNPIEGNGNMFQTQMGYGVAPLSDATEGLLPLYNSLVSSSNADHSSIHQKAAAAVMKSESGLTYNNNLPLQRKRSRIQSIQSFLFLLRYNIPITTAPTTKLARRLSLFLAMIFCFIWSSNNWILIISSLNM